VPGELSTLLESCERTSDFRPQEANPELVTRLDEFRGEHRNHDLIVIGNARGGRTLIGIEAKADEPFGSKDVGSYLRSASTKEGSNAPARIRRLVSALFGPDGLDGDQVAVRYSTLRYQLLTALAGTLIEARRCSAEQAVLLVHEFRSTPVPRLDYVGTREVALARNAKAWEAFISVLGGTPRGDEPELVGPLHVPGSEAVPKDMPFFLGKVTVNLGDEPAFRRAAERAGAVSASSNR
jgi:hypothetical protein